MHAYRGRVDDDRTAQRKGQNIHVEVFQTLASLLGVLDQSVPLLVPLVLLQLHAY